MKPILLVFVDIDGVLNACERLLSFTLNEENLYNFAEFIHKAEEKYKVNIYLTSSWRRGFAKDMNVEESSPQMRLLVEKFDAYEIKLKGITPVSHKPFYEVKRDDEIRYKLRKLGNLYDKIITIDDDIELYSENVVDINLFLTNYKKGFTKNDIKDALKQIEKFRKV